MPKNITKTVYTFAELLAGEKDPESPITSRAVEKARQWLREGQTDHEWWDFVYDTWKEALSQIGFENADIHFSGFACQGDGASFTANVDLDKLIAFLADDIKASESVGYDGKDEDFRPWIVHKIGGKVTKPKYQRLLIDCVRNAVEDCRVERLHYGGSSVHEQTCNFTFSLTLGGEYTSDNGGTWNTDYPHLEKLANDFRTDAEELRRDLCRAIYKSLEEEYDYLTSDEAIAETAETAESNEYTFDEDGEREG
jgi:hypothetical protein